MYLKLCLPYVTVLHLGKEKSSVFLRLYLLMSQLKRSDMLYSLFRFKNHHCIELYMYMRKVLKNWKRLVAYRYSLRRACFAKYRFSHLHIRLSHREIWLLWHFIIIIIITILTKLTLLTILLLHVITSTDYIIPTLLTILSCNYLTLQTI